jgi:hypothetical protein
MEGKVFTDRTHGRGTVVLNSHGMPEREFAYFAHAFHRGAQELADGLRRTTQFGLYGRPTEDFRAYPVVFLYRHALELYMKAIILTGGPLLTSTGAAPANQSRVLKTHDLEDLRTDVERVFVACGWPPLELLRKAVADLHHVDDRAFAFRYPTNRQGSGALAAHFTFNLFEFAAALDELLPILRSAASGAEDAVDVLDNPLADQLLSREDAESE